MSVGGCRACAGTSEYQTVRLRFCGDSTFGGPRARTDARRGVRRAGRLRFCLRAAGGGRAGGSRRVQEAALAQIGARRHRDADDRLRVRPVASRRGRGPGRFGARRLRTSRRRHRGYRRDRGDRRTSGSESGIGTGRSTRGRRPRPHHAHRRPGAGRSRTDDRRALHPAASARQVAGAGRGRVGGIADRRRCRPHRDHETRSAAASLTRRAAPGAAGPPDRRRAAGAGLHRVGEPSAGPQRPRTDQRPDFRRVPRTRTTDRSAPHTAAAAGSPDADLHRPRHPPDADGRPVPQRVRGRLCARWDAGRAGSVHRQRVSAVTDQHLHRHGGQDLGDSRGPGDHRLPGHDGRIASAVQPADHDHPGTRRSAGGVHPHDAARVLRRPRFRRAGARRGRGAGVRHRRHLRHRSLAGRMGGPVRRPADRPGRHRFRGPRHEHPHAGQRRRLDVRQHRHVRELGAVHGDRSAGPATVHAALRARGRNETALRPDRDDRRPRGDDAAVQRIGAVGQGSDRHHDLPGGLPDQLLPVPPAGRAGLPPRCRPGPRHGAVPGHVAGPGPHRLRDVDHPAADEDGVRRRDPVPAVTFPGVTS
uniref:Uncharacterized protein n=1 Tax=Mycolicibacterium gilvum (strain PYR-GCK) TaxID=350054 RepID=A4T5H7_MYCGI|nr:hypothetical protein Mflv_1485 [Mycolicibacterium gilvum PYR-GCK]